MIFQVCLFFISFVFVPSTSQCYGRFDYYWREFAGTIPPDALPAIQGGCEGSVYIAQGYFGAYGILPAGLYPQVPEIEASAANKNLTTTKHIKVLCTPHPHLFQWIKTTNTKIIKLKDMCELVYGGIELDNIQFIGRKVQNGKLMVGKVYKFDDGTSVFALPANNPLKEIRYNEFEVLAYNCQEGCDAGVPWKH